MKKILLFLDELTNDDLDWIVQKGKKETIAPGRILIQEGVSIDALYIILSGSFSVVIESLDPKKLATISSGEVVGEISFIDARPPLATVIALESSVVLSVPRLQLTSKLQNDMGFSARFYHAISKCLADRVRGTVSRLGYGMDMEDLTTEQGELSQLDQDRSQLAEIKFNWLKASTK